MEHVLLGNPVLKSIKAGEAGGCWTFHRQVSAVPPGPFGAGTQRSAEGLGQDELRRPVVLFELLERATGTFVLTQACNKGRRGE